MKADIKKRWVEALRSGKYKQGTDVLRRRCDDGDSLCCLGVLCEILVADGVLGESVYDSYFGVYEYNDGETQSNLPSFLNDRLDLSTTAEATLIRMNDTEKLCFHEIADYIEENL